MYSTITAERSSADYGSAGIDDVASQHFAEMPQPAAPASLVYTVVPQRPVYTGYQNKSRVQNLPPPHNFFWGDLGTGIYGMFVPLTRVETLNEKLLRADIEQFHKTLGHEHSLHNVMGLPDGYVVEALEEAMFWIAENDDRYYPKKD